MGLTFSPKHTFDTFIVGEPSRAAFLAAREAGRRPGTRYNPLFLYGGTGTGKSHLLQAIAEEITARDPSVQIYRESYPVFAARLREAVEGGREASLREHFSFYDAFLLDDLDNDDAWLAVQREIAGWIDRCVREERQVVLTASRPLSVLVPLDDRFLSRIRQGLVVPLGGLDRRVREEVVSMILEGDGIDVPDDVRGLLGDLPVTDMREMVGIVNRLAISLKAEGVEPERPWVIRTLQRLVRDGEIRRFRVKGPDSPLFAGDVTRVEVTLDGEGRIVETGKAVGPDGVGRGEGVTHGPETATVGAEEPAREGAGVGDVPGPAGASPGTPDAAGAAPVGPETGETEGAGGVDLPEEGASIEFDESDGFILEWDREEDRLLNEL
jgi:chromosomal replication initiator protein